MIDDAPISSSIFGRFDEYSISGYQQYTTPATSAEFREDGDICALIFHYRNLFFTASGCAVISRLSSLSLRALWHFIAAGCRDRRRNAARTIIFTLQFTPARILLVSPRLHANNASSPRSAQWLSSRYFMHLIRTRPI